MKITLPKGIRDNRRLKLRKFTSGKWKAFYGEDFHTVHQEHFDDEYETMSAVPFDGDIDVKTQEPEP